MLWWASETSTVDVHSLILRAEKRSGWLAEPGDLSQADSRNS